MVQLIQINTVMPTAIAMHILVHSQPGNSAMLARQVMQTSDQALVKQVIVMPVNPTMFGMLILERAIDYAM